MKLEKNQNKIDHQKIIQDYISRGHFLQSGVWMEIKKRLGNRVEVLVRTTPHRLPISRETPPLEGELNNGELRQSKPLSPTVLPIPPRSIGTQRDRLSPRKEEQQALLGEINTTASNWMQFTDLKIFKTRVGYLPRVNVNKLDYGYLFNTAKKLNSAYVAVDPINIQTVDSLVDGETVLESNNKSLLSLTDKVLNIFKIAKAKPVHLKNSVLIYTDQSDEKLLADMKTKYRYNVRLAAKNNTITKFGNTEEDYNDFTEVYLETKKRQNYHGRDKNYLDVVWNTLGEFEKKDNKIYRMIAKTYVKDELVSAMFLFCYDGVVYYPYGGSYEKHRNLKPTYFQIYETLKWARDNNFQFFDFWGIEEEFDSNDGFSSFKMGFGGYKVTYFDSFDIIINPFKRRLIKLAEFIKKKL